MFYQFDRNSVGFKNVRHKNTSLSTSVWGRNIFDVNIYYEKSMELFILPREGALNKLKITGIESNIIQKSRISDEKQQEYKGKFSTLCVFNMFI